MEQTAWLTPAEVMRRVVRFKRDAYIEGFAALGISWSEPPNAKLGSPV